MTITYLIGNGFDIGLGLKTGYPDFINWYLSRPPQSPETAWLRSEILAKQEQWSDAEMAFGALKFSEHGAKVLDAYQYSPNFRVDRMPCFSSDATDFYVVLPNLNYGVNLEDFQLTTTTETITKTTTKTITKEDATITKDDWAVLQIIRENPVVTAEEIGDKLGLTRAGAIYHINKLKKITKIRRVGTPRNGHWEVT